MSLFSHEGRYLLRTNLVGRTTDQRTVILSRHTEPKPELRMLLDRMRLPLPPQPPPRITAKGQVAR